MDTRGLTLVTGSSGHVGAPLLDQLCADDVPALATTTASLDSADSAQVRHVDFGHPSTFAAALNGVERVFLMRPPAISDTKRYLRPFIAAMAEHDVRHVVFLSLMGVNRAMPHWRVEQDLRASTLPWTFLRPSFFAQNLGGAYRNDIADHDRLRLACGRGRTSFIDARDIGEVAAKVLIDPGAHVGQAYTLTGPEAFDYCRVASMLSARLGRTIRYEPLGLLQYRKELRAGGLSADYVNVQLLINVICRLGLAAKTTDKLAQLLRRPARTLESYITDHVDRWNETHNRND